MRKSSIALIVILSIPVLTMAYLMLEGATFAIVHNDGERDTRVSLQISAGNTFERTPDAPLAAAAYKLIWFEPKTAGELSVTCRDAGGFRRMFPVGADTPDRFMFSVIALKACRSLVSHTGFSL